MLLVLVVPYPSLSRVATVGHPMLSQISIWVFQCGPREFRKNLRPAQSSILHPAFEEKDRSLLQSPHVKKINHHLLVERQSNNGEDEVAAIGLMVAGIKAIITSRASQKGQTPSATSPVTILVVTSRYTTKIITF